MALRATRFQAATCAAASLLGAGCSGADAHVPDYDYRAGLLNPGDEARFHADAPRALPSSSSRTPVARPAEPRTAPPRPAVRKTERARFAEPPAAQPAVGRATPPISKPAPQQVIAMPTAGMDASDTLRATQRVDAAAALLGTPGLADRAFVAHVLRASGQDVDVDRGQPYARALHDKLKENGVPVANTAARAGDLVFFRDTADSNGNGKPDDGVTMVGVVERVEGSRAVFIAQRAEKVRRMAVDATRPMVVRDEHEQVVNTRLVRWPGSQVPLTTGQCLVGYMRPR